MVVLVVGVLTATPFLVSMSTSLISSRNSQVSTHEQYAFDGAYEDAVWELKYGTLAESLLEPCDSVNYSLPEEVNGLLPSIKVTRTSDCGGDDGLDFTTYQILVESGSRSFSREFNVGLLNTAPALVDITLPTPRDLKQSLVDNLSPYVPDSGKYGKRFKKAVEETEKSLDPKLWATMPGASGNGNDVIDPYRLNLKEGKKDFEHEVKAVKELKELLKGFADEKCGGVTSITLEYTGPGTIPVEAFLKDTPMGTYIVESEDPDVDSTFNNTFEVSATEATGGKLDPEIRLVVGGSEAAKIHTSCSKPIEIGDVYGDFTIDDLAKLPSTDPDQLQVSEESLEMARMAVQDLMSADRMLAEVFLDENQGLVAAKPENQEKVEKELQKAEKELAKGDAQRAGLKFQPDKVIKSYQKAWEHTSHAVKEAAKK
jgi:hypothetical protein